MQNQIDPIEHNSNKRPRFSLDANDEEEDATDQKNRESEGSHSKVLIWTVFDKNEPWTIVKRLHLRHPPRPLEHLTQVGYFSVSLSIHESVYLTRIRPSVKVCFRETLFFVHVSVWNRKLTQTKSSRRRTPSHFSS